ncbi:acyl carrier protein [Rhizobium helianthi]|uniref:Acyl carrier protein n=1 Tax=Rhizobium helianthi TaxID=1132695 RepID=A0ABW4M4U0_9HYPH
MTIEDKIKLILVNELFVEMPVDAIGLEDGLRDQVGLDSLGFSELRAQCEVSFGVSISDEHFIPKHFTSVQTLSALIAELQNAGR